VQRDKFANEIMKFEGSEISGFYSSLWSRLQTFHSDATFT